MYWCKSLLSCLERNDFASFAGLTFAYLQIFWPAQCLDSLTVHKVDRQCIFGLDKRPTKVGCKEARHGGCWDDVSQQLSNFHRTAYLDFCWCNGCIFSRGKYMSEKIWNCLSSNLGILKLSVLINQKIFKLSIKIFLKLSIKCSNRIRNINQHFSSNNEEYCQLALRSKYKVDFSTYFPLLFGPKLSTTSENFWNCL